MIAAYVLIGALALAAAAAFIAISSNSSSSTRGDPHISPGSGSTNGVQPDTRYADPLPSPPEGKLRQAALAADCKLRLHLPDEGHQHIPSADPEPAYRTSPPTSGPHLEEQQADGAYRETPRPAAVVHALEHGRLAIQYSPALPERLQLRLLGLYDSIYGGALLFPNPDMPYPIAATTWTNLIGCSADDPSAALSAISAFARATWGRYGGEPVSGISADSPTPAGLSR